jgi:hypothetical protein
MALAFGAPKEINSSSTPARVAARENEGPLGRICRACPVWKPGWIGRNSSAYSVVKPALGLIHCLKGNKCEDRKASDDQEEANIG